MNGYEHDTFRQRTKAIDPRNGTNIYAYCQCGGAPESHTDAMGKTTVYTHDLQGRRKTVTPPGTATITRDHDISGRRMVTCTPSAPALSAAMPLAD
jgi:YD repeat-containing protein